MVATAAEGEEQATGWSGLARRLGVLAALERQSVALWAPVALGAGCAAYIGLPVEPGWIEAVAPALVCVGFAVSLRRVLAPRWLNILAALLACMALGLLAGKVRTELVRAPVVHVDGPAMITGWVEDVASPGASGQRLIIAPVAIAGVAPEALPSRIRMTVKSGVVGPGAAIRFRGLLNPPPAPASPGAYDFARNAWFDRIGGVGVALSEPIIVDAPPPGWRVRLAMAINGARWTLAQRIAAKMSGEAAGLGAAMVTGHEAFVSQSTEDALRDAGLSHIISISGLHMAIVGGFVFFLVRTAIAAWPWLALRVPAKKVAAAAGLLALGVYLVASGSSPAAERAAITGAVAFGAILFDRRAISLHSLAVAAFVILFMQPEAVAEPGFQMSFAATAALVALAEVWVRPPSEINTPWPIRLFQRAGLWLGVSLAASFVAGLATGPFAIQHFNRVALFGLPANLLTEPLSSFVIMPALALGAVFEVFGLGGPFLTVASWGIEAMTGLARWIQTLPSATLLVASAPAVALPIAFAGILWLCLWRGTLRWLGLPLALAVTLWPRPELPIAWIASDGGAAAVRSGGEAVLMRPKAKLFAAELWAHRRGLTLPADGEGAQSGMFDCDSQSCAARYKGATRVSAWWTRRRPSPERLEQLCAASDILVLKPEVELPAACQGVQVLRQADFARGGAAELYEDGRIVWAQPLRGERPWTRLSDSDE